MDSYSRGKEAELLSLTIHELFAQTVRRFSEREALVACRQGQRYTYRELDIEVERVARGLAGLGLSPGSRVGVWATNCAEWVMLQLAAARAGLVLVNINPAYRSHELRYVLKASQVRAIFLRQSDERSYYREILREACQGQDLALDHVIYLGTEDWGDFLGQGRDLPAFTRVCDETANLQYTSGTTGSPKGVLLTHRNLVNNGRFIGMWVEVTEHDRICIPVPMYHCFGCVIGTMVAINNGAAMILPDDRFHARPTMEAVQNEKCTLLYGVPTMFIAQLNHPDFGLFDFSSLRGGIMAGAPCPIEIMKRVMHEMHCPDITIVYGQTESSPVITGSLVDDPVERRVTTVGCALPNTEVKLLDRETRSIVPIGKEGEVCTRGYLVMNGYDGDDDATADVIDAEGWLHTGDLAVMREDGYINLTGRARDVIIRGGENVYPKEVEDCLYTHPQIAHAEVVGVPDATLGEVVLAWIKPKDRAHPSEEDIRTFCRERMAYFKVPTYIRFVEEFPTTVTGKTQKYLIREREIELRGLQHVAAVKTA